MPMTDQELNDAVTRLVDEGHRVVLHGTTHLRLDRTQWRLEDLGGTESGIILCQSECRSENGHRICSVVCRPRADEV